MDEQGQSGPNQVKWGQTGPYGALQAEMGPNGPKQGQTVTNRAKWVKQGQFMPLGKCCKFIQTWPNSIKRDKISPSNICYP